jgi:hypothetical protein
MRGLDSHGCMSSGGLLLHRLWYIQFTNDGEFIDKLGDCQLLKESAHDTITYVRIMNCDMV